MPSTGERLFAQYAHAPNSMGYCGPQAADALARLARGEQVDVDVTAIARKFSGAWPYQDIVRELSGRENTLDAEVVRAYWTGNDLTEQIDPAEFGAALLALIKPQAGHYWAHLNDALLAEATPTHAFHVLAVYPWSRLLDPDRGEALHVLDSCRIGWGTVLEVGNGNVLVEHQPLHYDGELTLADAQVSQVQDDGFAADLAAGDLVALHWSRVCDRLRPDQAQRLEFWTRKQLELSNPRIRSQVP